MATVELRLSAHTAHVRTARLFTVAVARRIGFDDSVLEEVRLAVGEACARAVRLHQRTAPSKPVSVVVNDRDSFELAVSDALPVARAVVADLAAVPAAAAEGELVEGMSLALIRGLVEDVEVVPASSGGTTVLMRWPLPGT